MKTKSLLKKCAVVCILLIGIAETTNLNAQEFTVGALIYRINDQSSATVIRHVNGTGAAGGLSIPASVNYDGTNYMVTGIDSWCFNGCEGLTGIIIPNSITSIGYGALEGCSGLSEIYVTNGNPIYDSRDSCNAIIKTADNELISGCKNTIIPNSVTSIGGHAFSGCSGLTSITIPNYVTSIGVYAFSGCSGLTSITIPNYVTSIGGGAFMGCTSLTSITIPNSVTSIGNEAFRGCTSLTSITIPNSVTSTGEGVFGGCSGLVEIYVTNGNPVYDSRNNCNAVINTADNKLIAGCINTIIPNSVTSIGPRALLECTCLTSITIPNSVTSIGDEAFRGCTSLTSITIPNYVTSIGGGAFRECTSLTSITIPNSVTSIEGEAFRGCTSLTSITIPNYVTSIGGGAFRECTSLTSITIPNSVTSIGHNAFRECTSLTSITIPNSVTSIWGEAFRECTSLTSITIPNSVTSIDTEVFRGCSGLVEIYVTNGNPVYDSRNNCNAIIKTTDNKLISGCKNTVIPNSVTSIEIHAFSGCSGLTSITLPNSIRTIGRSAFESCEGLHEVISLATTPPFLYDFAFFDTNCQTLTVPCGCVSAYENSAWHNYFQNIIEDCSDVSELESNIASIYPNPTSGIVKIEAENIQNISIYNMLGEMVLESAASGDAFEYDFSNQLAGIYIIRLETAKGVVTKQIVVK